jgi:hypothetical protein
VLAGGGAKGAYQVGCLQALRDAGLHSQRIAAIAGTSVGAIHAVMFATGKLDEAEKIWTRLRRRYVIRVDRRRLYRIPLWCLAGLKSEFSPLKVSHLSNSMTHPVWWRRQLYPVVCAAAAFACLIAAPRFEVLQAPAIALAMLLGFCALLVVLNKRLRPHFLGSGFVTHAPLATQLDAAIAPGAWLRVRQSGTAIYATVSEFRPYTKSGVPWGGWVPRYERLDHMAREAAIDTLMAGSAMPGFSNVSMACGATRIDGAWTDNTPAAPLLFDPAIDIDVALVVYLKNTVRHRHRHNSLFRLAGLLVEEVVRGRKCSEDDLVEWARERWTAAGQHVNGRKVPRVALIVPSRRVGNFFSGTIWFSPSRAKELMEMGRQDTRRVLESMDLVQN